MNSRRGHGPTVAIVGAGAAGSLVALHLTRAAARRSTGLLERLSTLIDGAAADHVRWFETGLRSFSFHLTPLDVAGPFRGQMQALNDEASRAKAWIFT